MSIIAENFDLPKYNQNTFKGEPMHYTCHLYVKADGSSVISICGRDFPVKSIPSSHGRLIDENDVCNYITNRIDKFDCDTDRDHALMNVIADEITEDYHVPTIIEAEEINAKTERCHYEIGNYTVISSTHIGKEIVLAEKANANKGERYMCCFVENNGIYEIYTEAVCGDNFAEIVSVYGSRITESANVIIDEDEEFYDTYGPNTEITKDDCKVIDYGEDYLENKIIVIKGDVLYPEHRKATKQLYVCTGGFGSRPRSRGTAVYCTSLYDGHTTRFERPDILGIMESSNLPEWARKGLEQLENGENKA